MVRKKLVPCFVLLVRWQFTDSLLCPSLLLDWVVSLIRDGDTREFVFPLLTSIQGKDLILLILIKTQMSMIFYRAVRKLACSPDQATLFSAFLTHERQSRGLPGIRSGRLLFMNPPTRKIGAVGYCKAHRSVRFHDVDATCGDDAE